MDKIKKQGNEAENKVARILENLGVEYYVFNNVLLKTGGGTTQIDHVVISPYGVFVIETKSHKGTIFGDCSGKYWTQCLYGKKGGNYTFYNPYLQNAGHLKNLYKLFNLNCSYFLGLIVFTSDSVNISGVQCPNALTVGYLASTIYSHRNVLFSSDIVMMLVDKLKDANIQSRYQDCKHTKYVKDLQSNKGVLKYERNGRKK